MFEIERQLFKRRVFYIECEWITGVATDSDLLLRLVCLWQMTGVRGLKHPSTGLINNNKGLHPSSQDIKETIHDYSAQKGP